MSGDWLNNEKLFEMLQRLQKQMNRLSVEIEKTTVLIRDYNGLRERVDICERSLEDLRGRSTGGKEMWGYVVGGLGVLLALISYAVR